MLLKHQTQNEYIGSDYFSFTGDVGADADNVVTQAYTHLKTLDKYDEYTDV